ncbi:MAG: ROK family protein [Anaerolineae bacterium]|nr:ROK family protein [Anaerolineae bacterium]
MTIFPSLAFCMDIGGTRTKYGLMDVTCGDIVADAVAPTETSGLRSFVNAAAEALSRLCQETCINRHQVVGAGVGVPGYVADDVISMVWESLAFMEGTAFRPTLEAALKIPVRMENDARIVALGEAYYGGHGTVRRLLSLTLGTGLGFGLVIDRQLQERTSINHLSGHIPLRPGTKPCYCGFSGCLESWVNATALEEHYRARVSNSAAPIDTRTIFERAAQHDPAAEQAVHQLVADLTAGLNAYCYLFAPDVIVLGGGLSYSLDAWLPQIQQGLFAHPYEGYRAQVCLSSLKERAGLFGAASLWKPSEQGA